MAELLSLRRELGAIKGVPSSVVTMELADGGAPPSAVRHPAQLSVELHAGRIESPSRSPRLPSSPFPPPPPPSYPPPLSSRALKGTNGETPTKAVSA